MSAKLKPCPFCGGGTTKLLSKTHDSKGKCYGIPIFAEVYHYCEEIKGQSSTVILIGSDEESVITAWNTRATKDVE